MNRLNIFLPVSLLLFSACQKQQKQEQPQNPNIIIVYADDLGYGDVGAYGSTVLKTPNIDKLAEGGIRFSDSHASSSTCTPSRYALLIGEYPWRNEDAKILPGSAPLIIDTTQMTIPKMLKGKGYHTGIVGKWHLGLGIGEVDWNRRVSPGPNEVGFDYAYIMAATQDRTPTVYLENGMVEGLDPNDPIFVNYEQNFEGEPTGLDNPELLKMMWHHGDNNSIHNGIPRIGFLTPTSGAHAPKSKFLSITPSATVCGISSSRKNSASIGKYFDSATRVRLPMVRSIPASLMSCIESSFNLPLA